MITPAPNDHAGRIRRLALIESPTGDRPALDVLADVLEAEAMAAGLAVERERHDTGDHLVWTLPGSDVESAPLLFVTHYDTVWPVGTLARMPLSVEQDAHTGRLAGPGTYDAKAGIVVILEAVTRLRESDARHRPITVLVIADEEIGSPSARELVESHARSSHAVLGFEPPHPDGSLKTARLGSTRVQVAVTGVEAHAALDPEAGVSAIDELVDQLVIIRRLLAGHPSVIVNVGTIDGGGRTNVTAGHASADIGLRFVDLATEKTVLDALAALKPVRPRAVIAVTMLSNRPPWQQSAATEQLLDRVSKAAGRVGQLISGSVAAGAADTNLAGALGLPTLDGFGPSGGGAHASSEWLSLDSVQERIELLAAVIDELG